MHGGPCRVIHLSIHSVDCNSRPLLSQKRNNTRHKPGTPKTGPCAPCRLAPTAKQPATIRPHATLYHGCFQEKEKKCRHSPAAETPPGTQIPCKAPVLVWHTNRLRRAFLTLLSCPAWQCALLLGIHVHTRAIILHPEQLSLSHAHALHVSGCCRRGRGLLLARCCRTALRATREASPCLPLWASRKEVEAQQHNPQYTPLTYTSSIEACHHWHIMPIMLWPGSMPSAYPAHVLSHIIALISTKVVLIQCHPFLTAQTAACTPLPAPDLTFTNLQQRTDKTSCPLVPSQSPSPAPSCASGGTSRPSCHS